LRLFFLTIPKPLKQHPILEKDHPFRSIQGFRRKTPRPLKYITQVSHPEIAKEPLVPQVKRNFLR
jgi:hypothetical protein